MGLTKKKKRDGLERERGTVEVKSTFSPPSSVFYSSKHKVG